MCAFFRVSTLPKKGGFLYSCHLRLVTKKSSENGDPNTITSPPHRKNPSGSSIITMNVNSNMEITNPFYSGCLQAKVEGWTTLRACARNDPPNAAELGLCRAPPFEYLEIRIGTGNWDSATLMGWLTQIILSEVLGVPSSIESGAFGSSRDFYDPQAAIGT